MAGEPWPNRRLMVSTSSPDAISVLACVCRRECSVAVIFAASIAFDHSFVSALGERVEPFCRCRASLECSFVGLRELVIERGHIPLPNGFGTGIGTGQHSTGHYAAAARRSLSPQVSGG